MTSPGNSPWLSVVTVVKDDPEGFAQTRDSLLDQSLDGVEHVVIDSSDDDGAVPAILASQSSDAPPTRCLWVPPEGVYPAMNRGLAASSGEYVYFANAGDTFHSPSVLAQVAPVATSGRPDWMYGEVAIVDTHGHTVVTTRWDYASEQAACFSRGRFPAHQATFVRRSTLSSLGGFDEAYRIVADYAVFLRLSQRADPVYLDLVVATFTEGGLSTRRWRDSLREFHRARRDILRPTGLASAVERWGTLRQTIAMGVYRGVVRRPVT